MQNKRTNWYHKIILQSKKNKQTNKKKIPLDYNKSINNSAHKKLIVPYFRIALRVSSLLYQGFKKWNEIPLNLKHLESIKLFCRIYSICNNNPFVTYQKAYKEYNVIILWITHQVKNEYYILFHFTLSQNYKMIQLFLK